MSTFLHQCPLYLSTSQPASVADTFPPPYSLRLAFLNFPHTQTLTACFLLKTTSHVLFNCLWTFVLPHQCFFHILCNFIFFIWIKSFCVCLLFNMILFRTIYVTKTCMSSILWPGSTPLLICTIICLSTYLFFLFLGTWVIFRFWVLL